MTPAQIAAAYAGANLLILFALAALVVRQRGKHKISFGDGGVEPLQRAIRAHANAVEYVGPGLAGLAILALSGALAVELHVVGAMLTLGRALHGFGLSRQSGRSLGRFVGTLLTWLSFLAMAGLLLRVAFASG